MSGLISIGNTARSTGKIKTDRDNFDYAAVKRGGRCVTNGLYAYYDASNRDCFVPGSETLVDLSNGGRNATYDAGGGSYTVHPNKAWRQRGPGACMFATGQVPVDGTSQAWNGSYFGTTSYPAEEEFANCQKRCAWTRSDSVFAGDATSYDVWAYHVGGLRGCTGGYLLDVNSQGNGSGGQTGKARALHDGSAAGSLGIVTNGSGPQDQWNIAEIKAGWSHIAVTWSNRNSFTLYTNGVSRGAFTKSSTTGNDGRLFLGGGSQWEWDSGTPWTGGWGMFRFYNRTLTAQDVEYNFAAGIERFQPGQSYY